MKKIIFLFLALVVLIGAGVGGWLVFGPKPDEKKEETAEPAAPVKPQGIPQFVTVGPIVVPVIGEKRVEQNILIVVSLEVYGDPVRDSVRQQTPRLVDAFLRALYGGIHTGNVIDGQLIRVDAVRDELMAASERVLGPGVVWDVLIQAVNQRPAL
ncbi:MAG: hypothetical protein RLY86_2874 [Pseudomonadota bacterium]|jgi:flagellar FliL protein